MRLGLVTLLVRDYDEAIEYFCKKLDFTLSEDNKISDQKRWVVLSTKQGASLLLAKAGSEEQQKYVGYAAGGRVAYFLYTDQFDTTYKKLRDAGVNFLETPRQENYGKVVQFADLYGNKWDLLEMMPKNGSFF